VPTPTALALASAVPGGLPPSPPVSQNASLSSASQVRTAPARVESGREPLANRLRLLEREMCADGTSWLDRHRLDFAMSGILLTAAPILATAFAVFTVFGAHRWAAVLSAIAALVLVVHIPLPWIKRRSSGGRWSLPIRSC
jgi:hypothetical protein